ncbi:MAG: response regulator transcription factor [Anaerolineae bacterium]|nr:response regulator transcription factor [Anaerolineae bacterium]
MARILIVEDDTVLAETLADNLSHEGHKVSTVADGESAYRRITNKAPDLIILDVMLPKLDGLSLCRMVRRNPETAHIPIIMLTARSGEVDKIVGLESGADDYIVKPFGLGEFLARVRAVMRRAPSRALVQDELVSGSLRLDMIGRHAYLDEQEINLSNKEYNLLVELMRNKNVVLSRDLLLSKVWGADYFGDPRTVDVHIRWLRKKIEPDASNPTRIVTVRGIGYRFEG